MIKQVRAFLKDYTAEEGAPTELAGITFKACSKALYGQGILSFTKRDKALANLATLIGHLWKRIEIKTNNLATVLWEGFITDIDVNFNEVTFTCKEGVGILDGHIARHSSILDHGTVTDLGANYIIDENAAFVEAVVHGKGCFFTDASQPSVDSGIYPNSNSSIYTAPGEDAPAVTSGTYANAKPDGLSWYWHKTDGQNYAKAANGFELVFTLPHESDTTKIEFFLLIEFLRHDVYTLEAERPVIEVYDDTNTVWRGVANQNADIEGEGYIPGWTGSPVSFEVKIVGNISNYTDGSDQVKIRVVSGDPYANDPKTQWQMMRIWIAKCTATYDPVFDTAQATAYIIDAVPSATRLNFTGQDPDGDGVGDGDQYRIGDLVHTVMADLFLASEEAHLAQEIEASGEYDATDYYFTYLGAALRSLADRDSRYYWQKIGWTFRCYSTYTATGYTINEANTVENQDNRGWNYNISGKEIYKSVLVAGANNEVFLRNTGAKYPSPLSLIVSDQSMTTETAARKLARELCLKHDAPKERLTCTIDYDAATWTALDIGKSISVDLYTIVFTALIVRMSFFQEAGGNLLVSLTLENTA